MPKPKEPTAATLKRQNADIQRRRTKRVQERTKKQQEKQKIQQAIDLDTRAIKALEREAAANAQQLHEAKLRRPLRHPVYNLRHQPVLPKTRARGRKVLRVITEWVGAFMFLAVVIGVIAILSSLRSANGVESPAPAARRTAVVSATGGIGVKHRDTPDATTGSNGGPAEGAQVQLLHYSAGWWEVAEPDGRRGYIEDRYLRCDGRVCTEGMLDMER